MTSDKMFSVRYDAIQQFSKRVEKELVRIERRKKIILQRAKGALTACK